MPQKPPAPSSVQLQQLAQQLAGPKRYTKADEDVDIGFASLLKRYPHPTEDVITANLDPEYLPKVYPPNFAQPGPIIMDTQDARPIDQIIRRFLNPEQYQNLKQIQRPMNRPTADLIQYQNEQVQKNPKLKREVGILDPTQPEGTNLLGTTTMPASKDYGHMWLSPRVNIQSPEGMRVLIHELAHHLGNPNEAYGNALGDLAGYGPPAPPVAPSKKK